MSGTNGSATFSHNGTEYTVTFEVITPEVAQSYMARNARNRKMTESHLQQIQSAMKSGEWVVNGAAIVFDSEGNLSDGQHRLMACIRTECQMPTLVVRGVEPTKAQDTTDNTRRRTLSTQLQLRGEQNYRALSGAIICHHQLEHHGSIGVSTSYAPSVAKGLRLLEENPGLRESAKMANRVKEPPVRYPAGLATALHYRAVSAAPEDGDVFWTRLADSHGLRRGDPILALRERMIEEASRNKSSARMNLRYRAAITIKAWNAWVEGREIRTLYWRSGGASPEAFPQMVVPKDLGA